MGFFSVPGRPSKNEEMIAEKVASATAVDEFIGAEIAKYTSDASRTIFRKVKSKV